MLLDLLKLARYGRGSQVRRLLLAAVGYGDCREVVYVVVAYGYPGATSGSSAHASNEKLFTAMLELVASLGFVPVIVAGGLNTDVTDVENSRALMSALGAGHIFDTVMWSAHSRGFEPLPTSARSDNRLEHVLMNREAFACLVDAGKDGNHGFPNHAPVFADLSLSSFRRTYCLIREVPRHIPAPAEHQHVDPDVARAQVEVLQDDFVAPCSCGPKS